MAYDGATNPVRQIASAGISGDGSSTWEYRSAHTAAQVAAANFFTSAAGYGSPGMRVGDLLVNVNTGDGTVTWHSVTALSAGGLRTPQNATVSAVFTPS